MIGGQIRDKKRYIYFWCLIRLHFQEVNGIRYIDMQSRVENSEEVIIFK